MKIILIAAALALLSSCAQNPPPATRPQESQVQQLTTLAEGSFGYTSIAVFEVPDSGERFVVARYSESTSVAALNPRPAAPVEAK